MRKFSLFRVVVCFALCLALGAVLIGCKEEVILPSSGQFTLEVYGEGHTSYIVLFDYKDELLRHISDHITWNYDRDSHESEFATRIAGHLELHPRKTRLDK